MSSTEFTSQILQNHNKYRARHGVTDLKISDKLNKFAQEWADKLASKDKAEHRPDNPYGENLYMAGSTDPNWKLSAEIPVKSWYDEIKLYKFGEASPSNSGEVGHFTQLVWKDTTEVGVGVAKSKTGKVYVVCNYEPPGNVLREFGKNVLPLEKTAQSMEDIEHEQGIVLTESQEKMGIRIVQPNIKVVESMNRLYAVPSEKIRVWSVWLTKVEEEANEWHSWLRSHINLVLRMSEYLLRAEEEIAKEAELTSDKILEKQDATTIGDEEQVEKVWWAADIDEELEKLSRGTRKANNRETVRFEERNSAVVSTYETKIPSPGMSERTEKASDNEGTISSENSEEASGVEAFERLPTGLDISLNEESNEDTNDKNREENRESSDAKGETKKLEKIAWPIGVPWKSLVEQTSMEEQEVVKKKEDQVKVIPIPGNIEDMLSLIKDVKRQATIYRSFYKHWLEVADQAVKEIMNRTVMSSERIPTEEEIPYFFYLYAEPDIEIGVEHDDETILLPDSTREKITCEFTSLYFNLADKPGKGGKPWL